MLKSRLSQGPEKASEPLGLVTVLGKREDGRSKVTPAASFQQHQDWNLARILTAASLARVFTLNPWDAPIGLLANRDWSLYPLSPATAS